MQATFGNLARVDQDSWQPGQSPNVSQHCWCIQIGYRPRVSDRPFSEAGILKDHLTLSWQSTVVAFLVSRLSRKDSIAFVLSAVKARAVLCPVGHFVPKRQTSKWKCLRSPTFSRDQLVQPGAIVSHINRILSYLNAIFSRSMKCLKITYLSEIYLCIPRRLN